MPATQDELSAISNQPSARRTIRVYNTLTKSKEPFVTLRAGQVGIYLCGPTVYKPSHMGHMVGPVIFDCVKRYLTYSGYKVTLVVNITDVDDKLIVESKDRGMEMSDLAREMTADYFNNLQALGVDTIDHSPRATEHIGEIVAFIQDLIDKGYAYAAAGDVYFDVTRFAEYGKLSHRSREQMQGEGGDTADRKRSPFDFALWKSAKPGEPSWDSPWGQGRPGWHIECSAMSRRLLGESFDIHGGGLDLVFPHHENEVAQSECCHGKPLATFWMHNGLLQASHELGKLGGRNTRAAGELDDSAQVEGKEGKSKGARPFRDLLEQFDGETIRFFLLSTHYRRPFDFSDERIREVQAGLETFYRFFERFKQVSGEDFYGLVHEKRREAAASEATDSLMVVAFREHRAKFLEHMDDDFNTGGAVGVLFNFLKDLNRFVDSEKLEDPARRGTPKLTEAISVLKQAAAILRELAATLGLFRAPPASKVAPVQEALSGKLMDLLIRLRAQARSAKNFALADQIRKDLAELGVVLEDRPGGTEWSAKRT